MDATDQNPEQVRSVKRKYVRKSVEGADVVETVEVAEVAPVVSINPAQSYANRVWAGQSPDVPVAERLQRVRAALAGQNLDCAGVIVGGNKP
jgi:hypothetical protein